MSHWVLFIITTVCIYIIASVVVLKLRIHKAYSYLKDMFPIGTMQFSDSSLRKKTSLNNILVIGDSLARGVGATSPQHTISGQLNSYYNVNVETFAIIGITLNNFQLFKTRIESKQNDLIIISLGGNDLLQYKSIKSFETLIKEICEYIHDKAKTILWIYPGSMVKGVPLLDGPLAPLRKLIKMRSEITDSLFLNITNTYDNIHFISYSFLSKNDTSNFFNKDGLHPGNNGYRVSTKPIIDTINKIYRIRTASTASTTNESV